MAKPRQPRRCAWLTQAHHPISATNVAGQPTFLLFNYPPQERQKCSGTALTFVFAPDLDIATHVAKMYTNLYFGSPVSNSVLPLVIGEPLDRARRTGHDEERWKNKSLPPPVPQMGLREVHRP